MNDAAPMHDFSNDGRLCTFTGIPRAEIVRDMDRPSQYKSRLGCALTFASEAKFEIDQIEAKRKILSEKKAKKSKTTEKIDLNFASLCFTSKRKFTKVKRSEKFEAKISEKMEVNKRNTCETDPISL